MKPKVPKSGYPSLVYDAKAPGDLRANGVVSTTHRVELRFDVYSTEELARAKAEVLKSPTELTYLKDSKIANPSETVEVKPAPISAAVIEIQYFDDTLSTARTRSIARQSSFSIYFDLTDDQIKTLSDGINDGQLKFMAHLRSRGEGSGWSWGEMASKMTAKTAESELAQLKKTADRRGMKDMVFIQDVANATRNFAAQATITIRTNDARLVGSLQPDDFATLFAEAMRLMSIADLAKGNEKFGEAIAEHLIPLINQTLVSQGRSELTEDQKRHIKEKTKSSGGGFSLPFVGGDSSSTSTDTIIESVLKSSGFKYQKDEANKCFALTEVEVRTLRDAASFNEVRIHKSIVIEGTLANYWLTLAPARVTFKADEVKAALGVQALATQVNHELRQLREAAHDDAQRLVVRAEERLAQANDRESATFDACNKALLELKSLEATKGRLIDQYLARYQGGVTPSQKLGERIALDEIMRVNRELALAATRYRGAAREASQALADMNSARKDLDVANDSLKRAEDLLNSKP